MTDPPNHSREQVLAALNAAADDILDAVDAPDEGLRDGLNLLVNAAGYHLDHPNAELADVVADNYSTDLPSVLAWVRS